MTSQLSSRRNVTPSPIPDRLYFKIGDVARICGLETYVLRFWETQFPQLKPNKSGTGQRLYRRRDVETALEIKRLVHAEGYTLSGARQVLGQARRQPLPMPAPRQEPRHESPSRLPLLGDEAAQRLDAFAAAIGHARAELREIAGLFASQPSRPSHRRSRMAAAPDPSGFLFPS
ncbi:MAG: MerR family transcriptional regulator [Terracidiphilus sp.]